MPRPPRLQPPGGIFHLTSRGNRRQPIFVEEIDRQRCLERIATAVERFEWICHAYCLMGNHLHLLVTTPKENLSSSMQWLLGRYAQGFNARHALDGHLFQGRFKSRLVLSEPHLVELARYVVLNPVRAGMCRSAAEWPWSSYRATAGLSRVRSFLSTDWLLEQFGRNRETARAAYVDFVESGAQRRAA
jgi:REP-associated tyrosine transposase